MSDIFNEFGSSLARGGSWVGFSHEIECDDGTEIRKYGWKIRDAGHLLEIYARIWIGKRVLVISGKGFEWKKKGEWALKPILGFEFRRP